MFKKILVLTALVMSSILTGAIWWIVMREAERVSIPTALIVLVTVWAATSIAGFAAYVSGDLNHD